MKRLCIVHQSCTEFYKDEGGKMNHISMIVRLEPLRKDINQPIKLEASLYYESETRVEEKDQDILNILVQEGEILEIDPISGTCEMRFRLEKVSRRKDGQRFKVKVEAASRISNIQPAFSQPICVYSKRKHDRSHESNKRSKMSTEEFIFRVAERLKSMEEKMSNIIDEIREQNKAQSSRIEALEKTISNLSRTVESTNQQVQSTAQFLVQFPNEDEKSSEPPLSPIPSHVPDIRRLNSGDWATVFETPQDSIQREKSCDFDFFLPKG